MEHSFHCLPLGRPSTAGNVAQMVTHRYSKNYKMDHNERGDALIFSHELFDDKQLQKRPQTNIDSANLERVLQHLGFNVTIYKDLRYKEINRKIKAAVKKDRSNHDCILVAILTNGENNDVIYAKDMAYKLESIWQSFAADKCLTLAGKPKVFIVEACRGRRSDSGYTIEPFSEQTETDSDSRSSYRLPIYADFLIAFCTVPEYCSWSNSMEGSWFMNHLCHELKASDRDLNILHLLTFVAQRVSCRESCDEQLKQITCTMSTLTRILCFGRNRRY